MTKKVPTQRPRECRPRTAQNPPKDILEILRKGVVHTTISKGPCTPEVGDILYKCIVFTSYHLVFLLKIRYVPYMWLPCLGTNEVKRHPVRP